MTKYVYSAIQNGFKQLYISNQVTEDFHKIYKALM